MTADSPLRRVLWRTHGLAALLATPFLLIAAVTGLVYVVAPQVEAWRDAPLDVVASRPALPLDQLVHAAQDAAPAGMRLRQVVVPAAADAHSASAASLRAVFAPAAPAATRATDATPTAHAGHRSAAAGATAGPATGATARGAADEVVVFIDPGDARVLGTQPVSARYSHWARRLHSALLQGDGWRWMIEWAATCLLVMLATGVALWWPQPGQALVPRRGARGRIAWKQWHAFAGALMAVMSLAIVLTGLTWSRYAGTQIRALRDQVGQAPPRAPAGLASTPLPGAEPLRWQAVLALARQQASPGASWQMTPPRSAQGTWRLSTADRSRPADRLELQIDAYGGQTLYRAGWNDQTAFAKATAIGIPFHRGEFGWWNQALLVLFGLTVVFSTVSGWLMWFKRRRSGWLGLAPLPARAWRGVLLPRLPGLSGLSGPQRWPALLARIVVRMALRMAVLALGLALCALAPLLLAFVALLLLVEWQAARAVPLLRPAPA